MTSSYNTDTLAYTNATAVPITETTVCWVIEATKSINCKNGKPYAKYSLYNRAKDLCRQWLMQIYFMRGTSLPNPTGKYKVGRMSIQLTDQNRLEAYSKEKEDKKRELVVWIWYPAEPISDSKRAIYLPDRWSEADLVYGVRLGTTKFECHSFENASVAQSQSTYPVIIFSQAGFSVLSYSAIIEEMASHGYIIVGINHTYDAPITVFSDGRVIPASSQFMEGVNSRAGSMEESFQFRAAVADYKTADIKFVADQLENIHK